MKPKRFVLSLAALGSATPAFAQYTLSTLASFNGANGANPWAGVVSDAAGNLYGTTGFGGANGDGTVFELNPTTHVLTTLATFNGTNGLDPADSLIFDAAGNLYGTAAWGGANNDGTVFEVANGTQTIVTLATFNGSNGWTPTSSLTFDRAGNLYGTTDSGGGGTGSVFEVAAGTHTITTLITFNGTNGSNPWFALISDSAGNLYGTTGTGGANNVGTAFEIASVTHVLTTLATFNGTNGANPGANLISDASGNLYGTTEFGGVNNLGTVFELNPTTHAVTTLATFNGTNGYSPVGNLIFDAAGNLYGTTSERDGVADAGTVFEIAAGTDTLTTLAMFNGTNGYQPIDGLIFDAAGNLYGTTYYGGTSNDGTVFELSPTSVPEPTSLSLLGLSGLGLLVRRRRACKSR